MGSVSFLVFKNCASLIFKLNFYGLVYGMYFLKFASRQNAPFHNLKYLIKPSTKQRATKTTWTIQEYPADQ